MTAETQPLPCSVAPCPFCGATGDALRVQTPTCTPTSPYTPTDRAYPVLRCWECGAEVAGENWDTLGASAIAAWNCRAPAGWRQIETAPKDRLVDILIRDSDGDGELIRWCDCYYDDICGEWRTSRPGGRLVMIKARHVIGWMDAPALAPPGAIRALGAGGQHG